MTRSTEAKAPSSGLAEYLERRRATWHEYVAASAKRGESSRPKLTYDGAMLELLTPALGHEQLVSVFEFVVLRHCLETNIEVCPSGSWTLINEAKRIGLEPDTGFLFKDFEKPVRPDLVLEVAWSRGIGDKLGLYERFRVPEVWVWHKQEISIYVLGRDGYEQTTKSIWLPELDVERVAAAVYPPSTLSVSMKRYRGK